MKTNTMVTSKSRTIDSKEIIDHEDKANKAIMTIVAVVTIFAFVISNYYS